MNWLNIKKEYIVKERRRKAREAALQEQEMDTLKTRRKKLGSGLRSLLPGGSEPVPRPKAEKEESGDELLNGPSATERPPSAKLNIPIDELPKATRPPGSASSTKSSKSDQGSTGSQGDNGDDN